VYHKLMQYATLLDAKLDAPDCAWSACLRDIDKEGMSSVMDMLGPMTSQAVLMMMDQKGMPVLYSWLTRDEFETIRRSEEDFKPALKAWLERLDWPDESN